MTAQRDESGESRTPFRFVHCSDVHLDAPFTCADDTVRGRLADEARNTLARLAELCIDDEAHALLIAGDLFDDERLAFGTEALVVETFGRLASLGVKVVIACGNHDHAGSGGRMAAIAWPAGVTVVGAEPQIVEVHDTQGRLVGRVVAAGHGSAHEMSRLATMLPAVNQDVPSVALMHGRCNGARNASRHEALAPCNADDFTAAGHRYWALGHVHERQMVCRKPLAYYSGCLLPHSFAEPGMHGVLLVTIAGSDPKVEFKPLGLVRFEIPDVKDLSAAADIAGVRAACLAAFESLRAEDGRPDALWLLRFELSGPCPAAADCQREDLLDELGEELTAALRPFGVLHAEVSDAGVTRPVDLAPHVGRPHLLGEALAVAQSLKDDEVLDRLVPRELAGGANAIDKRAYVRALLRDIEGATAEALLKEVRS